jgi:hypothetical protein
MYARVSSGLWTPCAPRGVVSFSRGDRVVAALQALDVIAIPICRHVSFRLCIIKGRENPEKAAKTFAAQTNSPIPLLRDLLAGVRLRRLIGKRADG